MKRQCSECKTVWESQAPYCEACGCKFSEHPPVDLGTRWKYPVSAITIGLAVAVWVYLNQA